MYNRYGKENIKEDVKRMYILLSGTLAVVISAVIEVLQSHLLLLYMLDVVYIQRSILWYDYIPTGHLYRCQGMVSLLFSWMIYAIHNPLLLSEYCLLLL